MPAAATIGSHSPMRASLVITRDDTTGSQASASFTPKPEPTAGEQVREKSRTSPGRSTRTPLVEALPSDVPCPGGSRPGKHAVELPLESRQYRAQSPDPVRDFGGVTAAKRPYRTGPSRSIIGGDNP